MSAGTPNTNAGRIVGLAAFVVVLVAGAWWLLADDGDVRGRAETLGARGEPVVAPPIAPAHAAPDTAPAPTAGASPLAPDVTEPEALTAPTAVLRTADDLASSRVHVVDEAGAPVADAQVVMTTAGDTVLRIFGRTDADGLLGVELLDQGHLFAEHDEAGVSRRFHIDALADAGRVTLTLRPERTVVGLVQDGLGQPVAGAAVVASPGESTARFTAPRPERVETDDRGSFALRVSDWWDGTLAASIQTFGSPDVPVVRDTTHLLTIPARWTIAGTVFDARGDPVDGAVVSTWRRHPGVDIDRDELDGLAPSRSFTTTRSRGDFVVYVDGPGEYALLADTSDAPPSDVTAVTVDDWTPRASTSITLSPASEITGRVVDGDGEPLHRVIVRARPAHLHEPERAKVGPTALVRLGKADDVTDAGGRFTLGPLRGDAEYIVSCRPDPNERDRRVVLTGVGGGTAGLQIVASEATLRRAEWTGAVFAEATGLAVDAPRVTLVIRLDGRVLPAELPPELPGDAQFAFRGLAPGFDYRLRVDGDGCGAWESRWWSAAIPGRHDVVHLPPPARLEVTTRPGARVTAVRRDDVFGVDGPLTHRADAAGRAVFDALVAGRYALTAGAETAEVTLTAGDTERVEL